MENYYIQSKMLEAKFWVIIKFSSIRRMYLSTGLFKRDVIKCERKKNKKQQAKEKIILKRQFEADNNRA